VITNAVFIKTRWRNKWGWKSY